MDLRRWRRGKREEENRYSVARVCVERERGRTEGTLRETREAREWRENRKEEY